MEVRVFGAGLREMGDCELRFLFSLPEAFIPADDGLCVGLLPPHHEPRRRRLRHVAGGP